MKVKITVSSKFGKSEEIVEIKDREEKHKLINRLRLVHQFDGATVTFSNFQKGYLEQIL